ncbi:MAG TPA: DciA family protein [Stellaceae bacterium]|nr:DciA family protein [Stellaceae bacterium]
MEQSNLVRPASEGERRAGFRAVGASLPRIVAPVLERHGGGVLARLKSHWAAIVGPELAEVAWPEALGRDGALKLRVAPGRALAVQHRAPLVIERINLFFGRPAVSRLSLIQAPLVLPPAAVPSASPPPLRPEDEAALERRLAAVPDPELRAALHRLGCRILAEAE